MAQTGEKKPKHKNGQSNRIADYISNIVVHLILIYVVFNLPSWFKIFTDSFGAIAWLLAISYTAEVIVYFIYLFFDRSWFKSLTQLAINLFNLIIFYSTLVIFPFKLNAANEMIARVIIYIIIFGTFIAVLVEVSKLIKYLFAKIAEVNNE